MRAMHSQTLEALTQTLAHWFGPTFVELRNKCTLQFHTYARVCTKGVLFRCLPYIVHMERDAYQRRGCIYSRGIVLGLENVNLRPMICWAYIG